MAYPRSVAGSVVIASVVAAWMSDRLAILSLQAACPATGDGSEVISKPLVRSDVPPPRRSPVVVQSPGLNRAGRPSTIICVNVNASALHKSRQTRLSVDQIAPVNEQIAANLTRWEREFPTEQFLASGTYPSPELQTLWWTEGELGYFHPLLRKGCALLDGVHPRLANLVDRGRTIYDGI
ncbi:hypothetical protein J6590_085099 [Homalodisca vitripennis]|nr:hypothetical protein J6590_085099 [Homalodisca vitripennis]